MGVKFSNNGHSTLASSITSSDTSITVASGHGARFPSLGAGDYFYATLIDASNNLEIVKCTARSSDVLTVARGQESTTARAYAIGDRIELRVTAQGIIDATTIASGAITATELATDSVGSDEIAANAVGASELNVSGNGTSGQFLRSDGDGSMTWADVSGGVLQVKKYNYTIFNYVQSSSYVSFGLDISITPVASDSRYWIEAWINLAPYNHDSNAVFNIHDSALGSSMNTTSQHCFQYNPVDYYSADVNMGYMNQWSTGSDASPDDYRSEMVVVNGLYIPASASGSTRTFKTVMRNHLTTAANGYYINRGFQDHPHQSVGTSHITVWELSSDVVA